MNIFTLDTNPVIAARYHCNEHIVKMITEYTQMLSTAHRVMDNISLDIDSKESLSKITHINNKCNLWIRESSNNYKWLFECYKELCRLYNTYSGKIHKASTYIDRLEKLPNKLQSNKVTALFCHIKSEIGAEVIVNNEIDYIASCRKLYLIDKSRFATFNKYGNPTPEWFIK